MACPICDQKPMNCDCTEVEKRQWPEIEDLRLTDAEREAIRSACGSVKMVGTEKCFNTLVGLLERLA